MASTTQLIDDETSGQRGQPGSKRLRSTEGWRLGVWIGFGSSSLVLLANIILVCLGARHGGYKDGIGILATGDSRYTSRLSTSCHVAINVFSTVLLSSSNYCMQIMSSPSRQTVDRAHARGQSVDIGIWSSHNLRYMRSSHKLIWLALASSSVLLHLFYNSAISQVTVGQEVLVSYMPAAKFQQTDFEAQGYKIYNSLKEWTHAYRDRYPMGHGDLVLSVDQFAFPAHVDLTNDTINWTNGSSLTGVKSSDSMLGWMSVPVSNFAGKYEPFVDLSVTLEYNPATNKSLFDIPMLKLNDAGWLVDNPQYSVHTVRAASQILKHASLVQIALPFMIIVIICNLTKAMVMFWLLLRDDGVRLITTGDALASFLLNPDMTTLGLCVATRPQITTTLKQQESSDLSRRFKWLAQKRRFWVSRYNVRRSETVCLSGFLLFVGCAALLGVLFAFISLVSGHTLEWGTSSTTYIRLSNNTTAFDASSILVNTFVANSPQVLLSGVYFILNTTLTAHSSALEWNRFGNRPQSLRVTSPRGRQISKHFLQLPYQRAIPLIIFSCLLHWLLSQTLFLARLEVRDRSGELVKDYSVCACGFSLISMFTTLFFFLGGIAYIASVVLKSSTDVVPFGANSSLILSAACHPPPEDKDNHLKFLMWGVVPSRLGGDSIGHCSLTSGRATAPEEGKEYA